MEEVGLQHGRSLSTSAAFIPDTGRLQVRSHAFFARASRAAGTVAAERGIETKLVTLPELRRMMQAMEFRHQLHWAIYAAAMLRGVCQDLTL